MADAVVARQQVLVGDIWLHISRPTRNRVAIATEAEVVVGAIAIVAAMTVSADTSDAQGAAAVLHAVTFGVVALRQHLGRVYIPLTTRDWVAVSTEAVIVVGTISTIAATAVNADTFPA